MVQRFFMTLQIPMKIPSFIQTGTVQSLLVLGKTKLFSWTKVYSEPEKTDLFELGVGRISSSPPIVKENRFLEVPKEIKSKKPENQTLHIQF